MWAAFLYRAFSLKRFDSISALITNGLKTLVLLEINEDNLYAKDKLLIFNDCTLSNIFSKNTLRFYNDNGLWRNSVVLCEPHVTFLVSLLQFPVGVKANIGVLQLNPHTISNPHHLPTITVHATLDPPLSSLRTADLTS